MPAAPAGQSHSHRQITAGGGAMCSARSSVAWRTTLEHSRLALRSDGLLMLAPVIVEQLSKAMEAFRSNPLIIPFCWSSRMSRLPCRMLIVPT